MGQIKSFKDLNCWIFARKFRREINSQVIQKLPKSEKYMLADQLTRASRSVTNNIAEGYGRKHFTDNARFISHAKGSVYEIIDHIEIAYEQEYIQLETKIQLDKDAEEVIRLLSGFERYLRRKPNTGPGQSGNP